MARAWAEAKAKEKADIARLDDEVRDKSKFKANMRKNANVVNRAAVESAAKTQPPPSPKAKEEVDTVERARLLAKEKEK